MKKTLILIGAAVLMSTGIANAATPNCSDTQKQIETSLKSAKLTASQKSTAEAAFKKGQDECKANKQADAMKEFDSIQKLLKKS